MSFVFLQMNKTYMIMEEIWKDIIIQADGNIFDFTGIYQISNLGRVKSLPREIIYSDGRVYYYEGKIKDLIKHKRDGYIYVRLNCNGNKLRKYFHCKVHRLVAEAFIPNPENKPCVDHIDTNKENNVVTNLRWSTLSENMKNQITYQHRSEVMKAVAFKSLETRKKNKTKTAEKDVLQYDLNLNLIREYKSVMEAHRITGYDFSGIAHCCRGDSKTYKGSIWRYKK